MIDILKTKKSELLTFLCLYIAQSIPTTFFSTILPIMFREQHVSLKTIGLISLIKLPSVFKFLWSPGVDRSSFKLIHYKRWIFSSELVYAILILIIAFLSLDNSAHLIVFLVFFSFIASSTQDIATDSLAVVSFSSKERNKVNTMQSIGNFMGVVIGSGVMLYIFDMLDTMDESSFWAQIFVWGDGNKIAVWTNMLLYLVIVVIVALIPLYFFRRKDNHKIIKEKHAEKPHINDLLGFFKQKGIWKQIIFLALFYMGLIGTLKMISSMLVDMGYTKSEIGIMMGLIGASCGCLGSIAGGLIVKRVGTHKARLLFAFCILLVTLYFALFGSLIPINVSTLHFGFCILWAAYGMSTLVVYNTSMDRVRPGYEGTDFTLQVVITHLSGIIISVLAGFIADAKNTGHGYTAAQGQVDGYLYLFKIEACIALVSLLFILWAFGWREKKKDRII